MPQLAAVYTSLHLPECVSLTPQLAGRAGLCGDKASTHFLIVPAFSKCCKAVHALCHDPTQCVL